MPSASENPANPPAAAQMPIFIASPNGKMYDTPNSDAPTYSANWPPSHFACGVRHISRVLYCLSAGGLACRSWSWPFLYLDQLSGSTCAGHQSFGGSFIKKAAAPAMTVRQMPWIQMNVGRKLPMLAPPVSPAMPPMAMIHGTAP